MALTLLAWSLRSPAGGLVVGVAGVASGPAGSRPCPQPVRTAASRASTARLRMGLDNGPPCLGRHRVRAAHEILLRRVREIVFEAGVAVVPGPGRGLEADADDVQSQGVVPGLGMLVRGLEVAARPRVVRRAVIRLRRPQRPPAALPSDGRSREW